MFASPWADAPCRPQDIGILTAIVVMYCIALILCGSYFSLFC